LPLETAQLVPSQLRPLPLRPAQEWKATRPVQLAEAPLALRVRLALAEAPLAEAPLALVPLVLVLPARARRPG